MVADREVRYRALLCKAIRLEVMPHLATVVEFLEMDMQVHNLLSCLIFLTSVLLNLCYVKEVKNTFGKQIAHKGSVIERRSFLCHGAKVILHLHIAKLLLSKFYNIVDKDIHGLLKLRR